MENVPKGRLASPEDRREDTSRARAPGRRRFLEPAAGTAALLAVSLVCGAGAATENIGPGTLRALIDRQVDGIEKLMVPEDNADLPQPLLPDGSIDPVFAITEERAFLGKQLFFDPVRTTNIQPEFGGVPETAQQASCGSCHIGEASGKAGEVFNGATGKEGRGFTDAEGNFFFRRRTLPGLVDTVPTLTEVFDENGVLVATGMFDAVDSVPRLSPNMVGFGFNTRLLLGGLAGNPGPDNPNNLTAGDNLTELTIQVHRMVDTQSAALQEIPVYVKLFQDAFPEEAAEAEAKDDLDILINDGTVARAMAAFLRTVVTRNTPWDKFLAGDNRALTAAQRRGAALYFTPATEGGAGCLSCHSGPMLNKQLGDEEGVLVEENFFNLGLGDHPLQALNAEVFNDPDFRDRGRMNDTGDPDDEFEIRAVTLRQLKTAGQFMHDGSFDDIRDVVQYFNAGIPADAEAAAAPTFTPRFSNPRGPGFPPGLGLSRRQVDDLTDFIENGLFDPAFIEFDPDSTTETFELNEEDLTYSVFRPDLAALGAVDGTVASGLNPSNNDPLSLRDEGLAFLDVTETVEVELIKRKRFGRRQFDTYRFTNTSDAIVDTNLLVIAGDLPRGVRLRDASEVTSDGDPFVRLFLDEGVLLPGQSIVETFTFKSRRFWRPRPVDVTFTLLSGQGTP